MEGKFSRTKPIVLITGLVMTILGIVILVHPLTAIVTLIRIMGIVLAAYGVFNIASAIVRGDPLRNSPGELALGAITLIPGAIMIINPSGLVTVAWTFVGVIILVTGVLDIMEAGDFRRQRNPLSLPATASGVITVLLGLGVIFAPLASASIGMLLAAIALIVDGITEIIFGLGM